MRLKHPVAFRHLSGKMVRHRLASLIRTPLFWWITVWGNACIFGGGLIFYYLERGQNPGLHGIIDSFVWAVGVVTTVGSGPVQPVTLPGKIFSIFMMMGGAVFLWSYMALFVGSLVDPELRAIQREIVEIQHEVSERS